MARSKRNLWLLLAAGLLVVGGVLTWLGDDPQRENRVVDFPTGMRGHEDERLRERIRAMHLLTGVGDAQRATEIEADPLMVALNGVAARGSVMVFELGAIAETPAGRLITRCFEERSADKMEEMQDALGLDPFTALERAAVTGDLALLEGDFGEVDLAGIAKNHAVEPYGEEGQIAWPEPGAEGGKWIGQWGDGMLMFADDRETLVESLDLLAGKAPYDQDVLPSDFAYGEVYGSFDVDDAAELFGELDDGVGAKIAEAAEHVGFHLDASDDVAMVADVAGNDGEVLDDLAKSLGGALAAARIKARIDGEDDLAELLDYASVDPEEGEFEMRLALPFEFLEDKLGDCSWLPDEEAAADPGTAGSSE